MKRLTHYLKRLTQNLPWIVAGLAVLAVLASLRPPKQKTEFDLAGFARLPAVMEGRIQPLESVARNSLLQIRTRQTVRTDAGEKMLAREWLAELFMDPGVADQRKVFRIDNLELRDMLKIPHDDKYFSYEQLQPSLERLQTEAPRIAEIKDKQRTALQTKLLELYHALVLYNRLKTGMRAVGSDDFAQELEHFEGLLGPARAAVEAQQVGASYDTNTLRLVLAHLDRFKFMADMGTPLLIPPEDPESEREAWSNVGGSLLSGQIEPPVRWYATLSSAYRAKDAPGFNKAVEEYSSWLTEHGLKREASKAGWEFLFSRVAPFYQALLMYLVAFLLVCGYWFKFVPWIRRTAVALIWVALILHTCGLITRMLLEGRPPVTNLYSSAIFIGWGSAVLGLILERFYKDGIGAMCSAVVGFITLIIAHGLALGGDTMIMLQAVLDTNFWLATHVTTVTLGYSATFVAGLLAILYLVLGVFTPLLNDAKAKSLSRMVYGIICFATLFSFVGTILGGIWADQSWGRFWGWDPKENGALMIVIWNAIYLHARWGRLVSDRVLMAFAVFGNVVTAFSWFGVNMLGVGLHSYGFMEKAFFYLVLFDISQVLIMGLAIVPLRHWRSFKSVPAAPPGRKLQEIPA